MGTGCGDSAGAPRTDAAERAPDVPFLVGGAGGTGGVYGFGGLATGGITSTMSGGGGSVALDASLGTGGTIPTGGNSAADGAGGSVGSGGTGLQPVDSAVAIDDGGQTTPRDGTKVQTVSLTAAQVFGQPTAPFLLQAELTRRADALFDVSAKVLVSLSGCTGEACNRQVTLHLTREQTTQVESWLAVIPGEACQDDQGPICDFGVHYAVGIDGPPKNQTCCKINEWGQNGHVTRLHGYLQGLAIAQLDPIDGSAG